MSGENQSADRPPAERRRFQRYKAALSVQFLSEGATAMARTQTSEISLGGCYIEMQLGLAVKTKLRLTLWVAGEKLATDAVVATHDPGFGNGIQFLNMPPEDQARLRKYLATLQQ